MSKKIYNLGKVKGRTPEFRLTEKILEIKYDDENTWSTLVDFSTIASSFDLRLNEETYFLEAQREVGGEWESMVDLSALKLAHEHRNKTILDKITSSVFTDMDDAIKKKHTHDNLNVLDGVTEELISKKHEHENIDNLNQIGSEQIGNINEIPTIKEDIEKLSFSSPVQLVKGFNNGLSANLDTIPTGENSWIEGKAAPPVAIFKDGTGISGQPYLSVTTSTNNKGTTINTDIIIPTNLDEAREEIKKYPYLSIVFEDNPTQTYYIKVISYVVEKYKFAARFQFIDGYDTFPTDSVAYRYIQTLIGYHKSGISSHSEGTNTVAIGNYAHAEGYGSIASGDCSHASGMNTTASGDYTYTEGYETVAEGDYAHAEGYHTTAKGDYAHAEGYETVAKGDYTHAEGYYTTAIGLNTTYGSAHAEGHYTTAQGFASHAEGQDTIASGYVSHAEGEDTIARGKCSHVQGKYNIEDTEDKYAHIVGNGYTYRGQITRSNAHTLDWEGNAWYAGTIEGAGIILPSTTEGSTKRFLITVDDTGTLTATEIIEATTETTE